MDAADFLIGANYSREAVLGMTPREIIFAVELAKARKHREMSDALVIAALGANDPKKAGELAQELAR